MHQDSAAWGDAAAAGDVVGAVDEGQFLVADVSRDDAWLAVSRDDAPVLAAYR